MNNQFQKQERLCHKKVITELFSTGKSYFKYPLKAIYQVEEQGDTPIKVLISVPKRIHKKAVDRNEIKRRVREAYRLNSHPLKELLQERGESINIIFIYLGKESIPFAEIERSFKKIVTHLTTK